MARFLVKASEFKNVCKAVNDRKLAELKKEIIEILKKQDEKEVKKAIDYFESQELHYTHLEKSFNGKWVEKAGYGIGTVRIWKGKKYKKIAPGKWARVFDKEGRGTNIAIGKLIARVNKIDNAEALLQFVMENKQRFVDEDGRELGILDKVRAAVDTRNEKLSGESSTYVYGVGENVNRAKNEMFSKKDKITKEEADLHKVSRRLSQIPTTELKQEKARLERAVANKTRSKRDSLNNAIFRESNQKKLDAINKELEKRSNKVAEKKVDNPYDSMNEKEIDIEVSKELDNLAAKSKKPTIHEAANYIKENNKELYNNLEKRWGDSLISALADVAIDRKNKKDNESEKPAEKKTKTQEDYEKEYEQSLKGKDDAETLDNIVEAYDKVAKKLRLEAKVKGMNPNELNDPELEALGKLRLVYSEKNISEGEKKYREELEKLSGRMKDAINNEFGYEEESEDEKKTKEVPFGGVDKNDEGEGIKYLEMADKINEVARKGELKVGDAIFKVDKDGKEWAVRSEIANAIRCKEGIDKINAEFEKTAKPKLEAELKEKLDKIKEKLPEIIKEGKLEENKKLVDERLKRYSEYADEGTTVNEVISKYKNKLINKLEKHVKDNALFTSKNETDIELLSDIDHQVELCSNNLSAAFYTECKKLLEESEAEKHQNRSDAMKGNQNAKKYGLTDEQIERYDIQEVVEEINGYPIVKNSEGKYSFVAEGRVKDRPEDFETNIDKVKERINDTYETKKNIQAAKDYDFKNAKLGSDIEYSKRSDGRHLYFKKSPDGSKVLSVTVNVSDMREPLNMVYEVSDTKTGESWQYETAYGNKEGLEWAVERPEQMEKEIKKFFKRDPNKEWEKQNTFDKEPSGIGTFEKIDEKTVEMPTDKATRVLFDNLNKSRSTEKVRAFMTDCYYDGENLVSTDGKRLTIIKTGDVGFEPGYVNVKTDGGKVTLERIEGKDKENRFPNYKKAIPENNNQEVKLNNKVLTEKLKEMRKNGSISKDIPKVALNFENGKVMLDGVQVGTADNVSFDDERQRIIVNANYLKDALNSGETSNMFVSDNPNKAMVLKTDISDTIVMPFTNDVDVEYENKTSKNESASFERVDFKSMSDDELKDYEEKLSKELDDLNANSPEFVEKYNYWREVHGENNDRFHQRIEDEARAEKQAEADAKAQKENEIKERYNGYFDGKKGLDKARDLKLLEKKYNFEGKGVMTSKDFVEQAIDNGEEIREREVNKLDYPSRTRWNRMNNYEQEQYEKRIKAAGKKMLYSIGGYEFPKGVVDYAKYYKEHGKEKSGNQKPSKSETAIKNKATSLAGAFGYSKTYATKMGSPFNLELAEQTVDEELDWDDGSKKALKEELRRIYSEKKVQKSIVDDFVMDMLVDEDEEDFEVHKIDESLWNDYSAEQPELYNSTEMMVREAFNRHGNCL